MLSPNSSIGLTALLIAAAASSMPDLFLSIIDAQEGHADDALSNPLGSNIFDLCIAFTIPLIIYTLINGQIDLSNTQNIIEIQYFILLMISITIIFLSSILFWKIQYFNLFHVILFTVLFITFVIVICQPKILNKILVYFL